MEDLIESVEPVGKTSRVWRIANLASEDKSFDFSFKILVRRLKEAEEQGAAKVVFSRRVKDTTGLEKAVGELPDADDVDVLILSQHGQFDSTMTLILNPTGLDDWVPLTCIPQFPPILYLDCCTEGADVADQWRIIDEIVGERSSGPVVVIANDGRVNFNDRHPRDWILDLCREGVHPRDTEKVLAFFECKAACSNQGWQARRVG